ncbi:MAG: hypothetical protein PHO37_01640 [Kiritimatiellae bacterium]|nr:hypothetical protein [Kiritimatiellia bacterium]
MKILLYSAVFGLCVQLSGYCAEVEARKKELNDAMAERAALMVKAHQTEERLDKAWNNKEYTSAEIEKLRERYQNLNLELIAVREKLKREVSKLPAVQQQAEEVKAMREKQAVLEEKIKDLNK